MSTAEINVELLAACEELFKRYTPIDPLNPMHDPTYVLARAAIATARAPEVNVIAITEDSLGG
jgi:hypothetical protein